MVRKTPEPISWDQCFIEMCRTIARRSKDPSTQTGCIVVRPDKSIVSAGYNGFPRGVKDTEDRYHDRPTKYAMIAHCDANAIFSAAKHGLSLAGCTMYLTGPPCDECTKAIIQAGVTEVVWPANNPFERDPATRARWDWSVSTGARMAEEAGVTFRRVEDL